MRAGVFVWAESRPGLMKSSPTLTCATRPPSLKKNRKSPPATTRKGKPPYRGPKPPQFRATLTPPLPMDLKSRRSRPQVPMDLNPQVPMDLNPQVPMDLNPQVPMDLNPQVPMDLSPGSTAPPPDVRRGYASPSKRQFSLGYALGGARPPFLLSVSPRHSLASHPAA